jgi:RNA polymerase sigma factor (sigma-70 family)
MDEYQFSERVARVLKEAEWWAGKKLGFEHCAAEDHQDAVAETVLGILRSESYKDFDLDKPGQGVPGSGTFETWFRKCVERKCKDIRYERMQAYLKAKDATPFLPPFMQGAGQEDTEGDGSCMGERERKQYEAKVIRHFKDREKREELFEDIKAAEKSLPDRQREVWRLTHHELYSRKEVAERLGLSEKQVKKDHEKATKRLQEALKQHDYRKRKGVAAVNQSAAGGVA